MANENRYYKIPFAESGNKTEVPDVSVGGTVGYDTGFGPDYELPQGQPNRKRIERDKYNGVLNGVTKNIKQWQEKLYPTWIEDDGTGSAFSYPAGMIVNHSGNDWISLEYNNTGEPGVGAKWAAKPTGLNNSGVISFATIAEAIASTDPLEIFEDAVLQIKGRGNALFDVVLASSVVTNSFEIVQSTGIPTLALVLRYTGEAKLTWFGCDSTGSGDSLPALNRMCDLSRAGKLTLVAYRGERYKISDTLNLQGVSGLFNFALITPDFDGKEAFIISNDTDISDLEAVPTETYQSDISLGDSSPRDSDSHGFQYEGRSTLRNIVARKFKGQGHYFTDGNLNSSELWNLRSYECNHGFFFGDNTGDNMSACQGSFYAFGNMNAGFYTSTGSNFRQNNFYIRSEFNNKTSDYTFGTQQIDCYFGYALRNDMVIYSEGTGGVADWNIYLDPNTAGSGSNNVNSVRQDKDYISNGNMSRNGNQFYQTQGNAGLPHSIFRAGNGNTSTSDLEIHLARGASTNLYGMLTGSSDAIHLADKNGVKRVKVSESGIEIGDFIVPDGSSTVEIASASFNSTESLAVSTRRTNLGKDVGEMNTLNADVDSAFTMIGFYNGNGKVGSISTNGSATTYATSSDPELKIFKDEHTDEDILEQFTKLNSSFHTFKWKSEPEGALTWGFNAWECIDAGLDMGVEREGGKETRDLPIGDIYKTDPPVIETQKRYILDNDGNETLDKDGSAAFELIDIEVKPEVQHRVTPASVDQSKAVAYLTPMVDLLHRELQECKSLIEKQGDLIDKLEADILKMDK